MPAGAIFVGRPTCRGNPWQIRRDRFGWMVQDPRWNWYPSTEAVARRFAVWSFRRWLLRSDFARRRVRIDELRGHDLACWCPLDQPCHADVLIELANS